MSTDIASQNNEAAEAARRAAEAAAARRAAEEAARKAAEAAARKAAEAAAKAAEEARQAANAAKAADAAKQAQAAKEADASRQMEEARAAKQEEAKAAEAQKKLEMENAAGKQMFAEGQEPGIINKPELDARQQAVDEGAQTLNTAKETAAREAAEAAKAKTDLETAKVQTQKAEAAAAKEASEAKTAQAEAESAQKTATEAKVAADKATAARKEAEARNPPLGTVETKALQNGTTTPSEPFTQLNGMPVNQQYNGSKGFYEATSIVSDESRVVANNPTKMTNAHFGAGTPGRANVLNAAADQAREEGKLSTPTNLNDVPQPQPPSPTPAGAPQGKPEEKPWHDGLGRLVNAAGDKLKGVGDMTGKVAGGIWDSGAGLVKTVTSGENWQKAGKEVMSDPGGATRDFFDGLGKAAYSAGPGLVGTVVGAGGEVIKQGINLPSNVLNAGAIALNQDKNFKAPTIDVNVFAAVTGKVEAVQKALSNWSTDFSGARNGSDVAIAKYGKDNAQSSLHQVGEVTCGVGDVIIGLAIGKVAVDAVTDGAKLAVKEAAKEASGATVSKLTRNIANLTEEAAKNESARIATNEIKEQIAKNALAAAKHDDQLKAVGKEVDRLTRHLNPQNAGDVAKNVLDNVVRGPEKLRTVMQSGESFIKDKLQDGAQWLGQTPGVQALAQAPGQVVDALLSHIPNNLKADLAVMAHNVLTTAETIAPQVLTKLNEQLVEPLKLMQTITAETATALGEAAYKLPGAIIDGVTPNVLKPVVNGAGDKLVDGASNVLNVMSLPFTKSYEVVEKLIFNDTNKYFYTRGLGATAVSQVVTTDPSKVHVSGGETISTIPGMQKVMSADPNAKFYGIFKDRNNPTDNWLGAAVRTPNEDQLISARPSTIGRVQGQNVKGNGPNGLIDMGADLLLPKDPNSTGAAGMKTNVIRAAEVSVGFNLGDRRLGFTGLANVTAGSIGYNNPYTTFSKDSQGRTLPGLTDAGAISPFGSGGFLGLRIGQFVPAMRFAWGSDGSMLASGGTNAPADLKAGSFKSPATGGATPVLLSNPAWTKEDGAHLQRVFNSLNPWAQQPQPEAPRP